MDKSFKRAPDGSFPQSKMPIDPEDSPAIKTLTASHRINEGSPLRPHIQLSDSPSTREMEIILEVCLLSPPARPYDPRHLHPKP